MTCRAKCCKEEKIFVLSNELSNIKHAYANSQVNFNFSGKCCFLKNNKCGIYELRPFECRIFPLDIEKINGKIMWIMWLWCPASARINIPVLIKNADKMAKQLGKEYILDYIRYHSAEESKYSSMKFKLIKEVRFI